jgi:tetratricopeptide (TPR) repeat protein
LPVLRGLARYYSYRGEYEKAIHIGEYTLSQGERLQDKDMQVVGHLTLGTNYAFSKQPELGLEHLEKGIACYDPQLKRSRRFRAGADPGVACYITSCMILWMLGFPERALHRGAETVNLTLRLNHPFSQAYALFHTGLLHLWTRQPQVADGYAHRLLDLASEYDFPVWQAVGTCLHGSAQVAMGRVEPGLEQLQQGMETYQGLNTPPIFWSLLIYNQAKAYLQAGKAQQGLDLLFKNMASLDPSNEGALLAEFYRLIGELHLGVSPQNTAEAENWFQQSLQIAQEFGVRMLALRTGLSLGRLWREQGKHEQARQVVGKIYGAMTEGFDIPDMVEARELLGEWFQRT